MTETETVRVALRFANEINRHDVEAMMALMSDNHLFVDGLGQEVYGKERLRAAWHAYFEMFPDYHMDVRDTCQSGRVVALLGTASGTFSAKGDRPVHNRWKLPAAWRVVIDQGLVAHWQVYADNQPVRKIMGIAPA